MSAKGHKGDGSFCAPTLTLFEDNLEGHKKNRPLCAPKSLEDFIARKLEEKGFLSYVEELDAGLGVVAGAFY